MVEPLLFCLKVNENQFYFVFLSVSLNILSFHYFCVGACASVFCVLHLANPLNLQCTRRFNTERAMGLKCLYVLTSLALLTLQLGVLAAWGLRPQTCVCVCAQTSLVTSSIAVVLLCHLCTPVTQLSTLPFHHTVSCTPTCFPSSEHTTPLGSE